MNFWKWGRERGRVDAFVFFVLFFLLFFFLERSMNAVEGIFWSFQLERRRRRRREGHGTWTTCGNFFFDLLVKSVATFEDPQLADPRSNENAGKFFKKCHFHLLGLNWFRSEKWSLLFVNFGFNSVNKTMKKLLKKWNKDKKKIETNGIGPVPRRRRSKKKIDRSDVATPPRLTEFFFVFFFGDPATFYRMATTRFRGPHGNLRLIELPSGRLAFATSPKKKTKQKKTKNC